MPDLTPCPMCTGDGGNGHTMRGACMGAPCPSCGDHRYRCECEPPAKPESGAPDV